MNFGKICIIDLSTFTIELPSLAERKDDIPLLALHFMSINAEKIGKNIQTMSKEYMDMLQRHAWPGNIRELKNVIERSVILADGTELTSETLPKEFLKVSLQPLKVESNGSQETVGEIVRFEIRRATPYP